MTGSLLDLDHVVKQFSEGGLLSRRHVTAVQDVSFAIDEDRPEIFAIVGESGSGKSTLARMILGSEVPTSGTLRFRGRDIATIRTRADREAFMAQVQPVFQNPFEAFNPLTRLDTYLFATARRFCAATSRPEAERVADEALHRVGLSLAEILQRYPHELSGGQLQRVAIARALISKPQLLVADEPVSMVDASLRMSIVNLFRTLRDELKVSIVYITHDLATTYYICDRIVIMQKGVVVESGAARAVLDAPGHPYTIALRGAVLPPDPVIAAAMLRPHAEEPARGQH
jgi:ABC-type glutathione transport system ATPase component